MVSINTTSTDIPDVSAALNAAKGESLQYRQIFDQLAPHLPFSEALVISSLPRGGLQIVQPPRLREVLTRSYTREMHAHDRLTWQAISQGHPVRASEAWAGADLENSRFYREFMMGNGLAFAVAMPLSAPVINGYPGAVHLYRTAAEGDFTDDEMARFEQFARELDEAIVRIREQRSPERGLRALRSCPVLSIREHQHGQDAVSRLWSSYHQFRLPIKTNDPHLLSGLGEGAD